jgi:hypothetical protein
MNSIPNANTENVVANKSQIIIGLKKYLIFPIRAGLYGFTLVFSVILVLKLLSFLFGINEAFNLDLMDVMLSSVGFFLMFLIYVLKNFHQ